MSASSLSFSSPSSRLPTWTLLAGLVAGTLDILYAMGFWAVLNVPPQRILQSVSAGLLGRDAFAGGASTAALGLGLHYAIALVMAAVYAAASVRVPRLRRHPWSNGTVYGLLLFAAMNLVVLPLSALPPGPKMPVWIACSVIAHVVLVGWPIALLVRRAWK